ncbi:MAG: carbamate kinase [Coriobacteriales bacterium]|jgi:carbamate kinase|nr:carbamate kinase [Coriobacteriales bacterium]
MSKIIVALGGNALGNNAQEQLERATVASKAIADLIEAGHELVIVHGNGPQVGQIRLAFEDSHAKGDVPLIPFAECIAMSQGYIGYHLQQAIDEELVARGHDDIPVIAMLTQVVVDANDSAFANPSKPIGGYYSESDAKRLMQETGNIYREDAGRGWRRVVPSPKPIDIYEKLTLKALMEDKQVVIACGGGGVPVVYSGTRYHGVDAVVDKDFAAAKLAHLVDADVLLILTAVDRVFINFNTPEQMALETITLAEAANYVEKGYFAAGSMLPKVQAGMMFVGGNNDANDCSASAITKNRRAIIGSLDKAADSLVGQSGTTIVAC